MDKGGGGEGDLGGDGSMSSITLRVVESSLTKGGSVGTPPDELLSMLCSSPPMSCGLLPLLLPASIDGSLVLRPDEDPDSRSRLDMIECERASRDSGDDPLVLGVELLPGLPRALLSSRSSVAELGGVDEDNDADLLLDENEGRCAWGRRRG